MRVVVLWKGGNWVFFTSNTPSPVMHLPPLVCAARSWPNRDINSSWRQASLEPRKALATFSPDWSRAACCSGCTGDAMMRKFKSSSAPESCLPSPLYFSPHAVGGPPPHHRHPTECLFLPLPCPVLCCVPWRGRNCWCQLAYKHFTP